MNARKFLTVVSALVTLLVAPTAVLAAPAQPSTNTDIAGPATPESIGVGKRGDLLGSGWQKSSDRAVTTTGDATGFHVLVADAKDGYRWRTVASLSEPGFDTDAWIGNMCVTASGDRAVVVYAPRTFTNKAELMERGGFAAIVDLNGGPVRKLPVQSTLAYFNPGCGPSESAVLTQSGAEDLGATRLLELDTTNGRLAKPIQVPGQLTSAVPTKGGIVAADSGALVRVHSDGKRTVLAPAKGVPYRLAADADGGVTYAQLEDQRTSAVRRVDMKAGNAVTTLATGATTDLSVRSSRGGRVFVTGTRASKARTTPPPSVKLAKVSHNAAMSLSGDLAVTSVLRAHTKDLRVAPDDPAAPQRVDITATSLSTDKTFTLSATPTADAGRGAQLSPALGVGTAAAGDPNDPADGDQRYCSVARNDPRNQAMQPKPRQVEWAVDQAIRGVLTVRRPANWKNLGMPAYTPQGLFPPRQMEGGGFVPAQVFLGITAQESNLWQAARYAVPGVTANPLIGNYFGIDYYNSDEGDDWTINWGDADCGYGVTQVTDGMRLAGKERPGEVALPYDQQRAIALDFAANIAKGLQILQDKWNQTRRAGLVINDGASDRIENWFFAVWAYNSGFHPNKNDGRPWGVGWLNNPVNPNYPADRLPFMEFSYEDAAHPQDWPYPEKVMGFAGHPIELIETPGNLIHAFQPAWWLTEQDRRDVKPPLTQFCDASNQCRPGESHTPDAPEVIGEPAGPCAHKNSAGQYDLKCWYHEPNTWKPTCEVTCGNELLRFDPGYAYQEDAASYPPVCTLNGLPSNAVVVDNLPQSTPSIRPGCTKPPSPGNFRFTFKQAANGTYPGKIDVHQIGAAYGGHFWMSNTHTAGGREAIGTWTLDHTRTGPMKIMVHIPDPGARTRLATYRVNASGGERRRIVRQEGPGGNRWVNIGTFMFNGTKPQVSLSNLTPDGDGTARIAWDSVAFIPVAGQYHEENVEAVAVFDEDQDIDTAPPGSWLAGPLANRNSLYQWARESADGILSSTTLGTATRQAVTTWKQQVEAAGTDPVDHPDGNSIGTWIGFAQPHTDRPTTSRRPNWFDNEDRFKIKLKASVSFVTGDDGKIIPGSEFAEYEHRTGNTHLPEFVRNLFRAVEQDYAIAKPRLWYRMPDLNRHDGAWRAADPSVDGRLPGRAYAYAGIAPQLTDTSGSPSETNASCVKALTSGGGSIGYRPMLSQSGPTGAMEAWSNRVKGDARIPSGVKELAEDVRDLFFNPGPVPAIGSSLFTDAPPIWQELFFLACADGSVRKTDPYSPLLRAGWMPDQYLYHNGSAIDRDGRQSGSAGPILRGNFFQFSMIPAAGSNTAFGQCESVNTDERSGNPWVIQSYIPANPGINPPFHRFCSNGTIDPDPAHSS
ncbi:golvesin C-terminal-like domain-containing protein [Actinomadura sp. 3N407]|uniref:golvesin C-terminal-like domain-containing protein n=1 Tax=Actinomadura sp. 3N407 TaxID=3457423 RepID=UPI003FCD1D7A